jgi:hypothetical protein
MRHDQFIGGCIPGNNAIIIAGLKGEGPVVPAVQSGSRNNGYSPPVQQRSIYPGIGIKGRQLGIGDVGSLGFRHVLKASHNFSFLC